MKTKKSRRIFAAIMALLLIVGIMPMDWAVTKTAASGTKYTFDASTEAAVTGVDVKKTVAEGKYGTDGYFTLSGTVTRGNSTSVMSAELAKGAEGKEAGALTFTVTGNADVTITATSTGGSNVSDLSILDAEGKKIANADGKEIAAVTGTKPATEVKFTNLAAGTYSVVVPTDGENNRGVRILKVDVDEIVTEVAVTTDYKFDAATEAAVTGVDVKKTVAEGKYGTDGYFTLSGTVTRGNSTSVMSAELAKGSAATETASAKEAGVLAFTVTGSADAVITATSTGGSNVSDLSILDAEGRKVADADGKEIAAVTGTKPATEVKYTGLAAGTYQIVVPTDGENNRGVRILSVVVSQTSGGARPDRKAWDKVVAPVIGDITADKGTVTVPFTMVIGYDGADSVAVDMKDSTGAVVATETFAKDGQAGSVSFTPSASGDYTFAIKALRKDETDKNGEDKKFIGYALPLAKAAITSATSQGAGAVSVVWDAVTEATSYEVSYSSNGTDFSAPVSVESTEYVFKGLNVGTEYTFKVVAVRSNPEAKAEDATTKATATAEAQQVWSFSAFGQGASNDEKKVGFTGNANDGKVTIRSYNGKIVPASTDGLAFYYTAIPADKNFTLSANVAVDSWTLSNGQEGFGLMAADRVGKSGSSSVFWNNSYMATVTKVEYWADETGATTLDTIKQGQTAAAPAGSGKVTMKLGIGSQEKVGVTKDNLAKLEANDTATVNNEFSSTMTALYNVGQGTGTYNIVGNASAAVSGTVDNAKTNFKMTIQKNNTGYFVSYTDEAGKTVTQKYYDTTALNKLDEENVYVGFFASRNATITVSDINVAVVDPANDTAKEERPVTTVVPSYKIVSSSVANAENYDLSYLANADGHVVIKDSEGTVIADEDVTADKKYTYKTTLKLGDNKFTVSMTPKEGFRPSEFEVLENYDAQEFEYKVTYNKIARDTIYVSPEGTAKGTGTKANPLDIYTATKYVAAGQTIVLRAGTYHLDKTVTVQPGIDGTKEAPITLMAEPNAERPVLDFGKNCEGVVLAGDYWNVQGFDVTNSANTKDGMRLAGSHCKVESVHTYHNGNTGLQISRYDSSVARDEWPSYNTVLNCTSYGNADEGYEDADGFAAKLTIGDGNVFDGCIAYNNADDGWDLFAKVESGSIGAVTIQNCVAYANGYLEDGTNAGNGNGFKMGGSSMSGYHKLINSVAFDNKAKGIDSNSCPDIQVTNSTSFNNGGSNVALYTNDAANTDFMATGVLSYRTQKTDVAETFKLKGTQDKSKVYQNTNYFWNCTEEGTNNSNGIVTDAWFTSVDTKMNYETRVYAATPVTRNADDTINMNGLLVTTDAAKAGAVVGGTAKTENTVPAEPDTDDKSFGVEKTVDVIGTTEVKETVLSKDAAFKTIDGTEVNESEVKVVVDDKLSKEKIANVNKALADSKITISPKATKVFYEVSLVDANNKELDLTTGSLKIVFAYPAGTNATDFVFNVYHVKDDGTVEKLAATPGADGIAVKTTSLSPFVVTYEAKTVEKPSIDEKTEQPATTADKTVDANQSAGQNIDNTAVQTGDSVNVTLYVLLLAVAVVAMAGAVVVTKKSHKKN